MASYKRQGKSIRSRIKLIFLLIALLNLHSTDVFSQNKKGASVKTVISKKEKQTGESSESKSIEVAKLDSILLLQKVILKGVEKAKPEVVNSAIAKIVGLKNIQEVGVYSDAGGECRIKVGVRRRKYDLTTTIDQMILSIKDNYIERIQLLTTEKDIFINSEPIDLTPDAVSGLHILVCKNGRELQYIRLWELLYCMNLRAGNVADTTLNLSARKPAATLIKK